MKIWIYAFHGIMKCVNYFIPYRTPEVISGPGCVLKVADVLKEKEISRVLVVSDKNMIELGIGKPMIDAITAAGIECTVFSDVEPNPTSDSVEKGVTAYHNGKCEAIVPFGGGTPMDCAKAIAARVVRPKKSVSKLQGLMKVRRKTPLLIAVPTTAGTGSETTVAAVITDSATHHKAAINDPYLIPSIAVLDPMLTVGLPKHVTATTGMDALCHAVEAYTNYTYCTRLEKEMALEAIKLVYENILTVYENGNDIEARQNMQKAAFKAGRAFTRGCVGYVHAIGHTLSGLYGVAHGLAMAVILPNLMTLYGKSVHKRLAEIGRYVGMTGGNDKEVAEKFIDWIYKTNAAMGIPGKFDCIKEEDIPQMISWAKSEGNPLYPVPQVWDDDDFYRAIKSIM